MAMAYNLTNRRYGKLFVMSRAANNTKGNTMWNCKCDCGNTCIALGYDLTHGRKTSCGCNIGRPGVPSKNRIDITGKKFGYLTVAKLDERKSKNGILVWECVCDCGKHTFVRGGNLKSGHTISCGCKANEAHYNSYENLIGKRFGRLIVVREANRTKRGMSWLCKCDCGNEKIVCGRDLHSGKTKSCGCLSAESRKKPKRITHGLSKTRIYRVYRSMISRCSPNYHNSNAYYQKGISVCEEWLNKNGFENFYKWSMENGYSDELSIDRINNDEDYSPENCRWTTMKEQENNRSNNITIEYIGETKTLKQWSEYLGLNYGMVKARWNRGWRVPELFSPKRKNQYL